MHITSTFISLFLLVSASVYAISEKDAFKRDWIGYMPGPLVKHALLDHRTILELSEKKIIYYKDIYSSKVEKYIDLSIHGSDDFKLGKTTIATFSKSSSLISIFDKATGIFITSLSLESPPIQLESYNNLGWTILQEGENHTELVSWDGTQLHNLGKFEARSFLQYNTSNNTFVCIDSKAFSLTSSDKIESGATPVVVTDADYDSTFDLIFPSKIVDDIKSTTQKNPPIYLTEDCVVTYFDTQLFISRMNQGEHMTIYSRSFDEIKDVLFLESILVVITDSQAHILNIKVFLENFSESSIRLKSVEVQPHLNQAAISAGHFITLNGVAETLTAHVYKINLDSWETQQISTTAFSATGGGIIENVPPLRNIEEAHHLVEEARSSSLIYIWLIRVKKHMSQFGRFIINFVSRKEITAVSFKEDGFGFNKIIVEVDENQALIAAKSSISGSQVWIHAFPNKRKIKEVKILGADVYVAFDDVVETLNLNTGEVISSRTFEDRIEKFVVLRADPNELDEISYSKALAVKIGDRLKFLTEGHVLSSSQYLLHKDSNTLRSYVVDGDYLRPIWHWNKPDEKLLKVVKNSDAMTSAGGIARFDRSVIYKYLNPNLVSILSETESGLKVTLLDGITGTVVYTQEHKGESIDPNSIHITQKDNWVVYSIYVTAPVSEQRIIVIDMFQDAKDSKILKTSFDTTNVTISTKAFLYPERIVALESTDSKFGITVKSIIALTESGSLVEIPKYILNSRRIDGRQMTAEDQMDDFRMLPYEPVIMHNSFTVLNHKNKIQLSSKKQSILISPTEFESTSVVCFVNEFNDFCSIIQPSSSYDLLASDFDKFKLIVTIVILFVAYIFTRPLVASKKLDMKWID